MAAPTFCEHGLHTKDCPPCKAARDRQWNKESYQRHRAQRLADVKGYRDRDPEKSKAAISKSNKARYQRMKVKAFEVLGDKCACCGESNPIFLTIDHIHNDGAEHRKIIGKGAFGIYGWLERNGWPTEGLQILCWNCNMGKRINGGQCPHKADQLQPSG